MSDCIVVCLYRFQYIWAVTWKRGKIIFSFFFLPNTCRLYNDFSPNMLRLNLVISKSKWCKMPLQINNYKLKKSKVPIVYYYIYYKGAIFFPYRFVHEKLFIGVQNNKVWLHLYLFPIFKKMRLTTLFFFWQIF